MSLLPFAENDDDRRIERARLAIRLLIAGAVLLAVLLVAAFSSRAEASLVKRSTKARLDFQRANPCPVNGKTRGSCPGYVIDHVVPLCAGGPDRPDNMQWQTIAAAREKDKLEVAKCRQKGTGYRHRRPIGAERPPQ